MNHTLDDMKNMLAAGSRIANGAEAVRGSVLEINNSFDDIAKIRRSPCRWPAMAFGEQYV